MAVKLRMTRTGARNSPSFRVVASDVHFPRDGRFNEILGWYDPKLEGENFCLKMDRVDDWLAHGAQVSDAVASLIGKARKGGGIQPEAELPVDVAEGAEMSADEAETSEAGVTEEPVEAVAEEPAEKTE